MISLYISIHSVARLQLLFTNRFNCVLKTLQSWLFPAQLAATVIGVETKVCVVMICFIGVAMVDSCPTWFTNTTGSYECGTELIIGCLES